MFKQKGKPGNILRNIATIFTVQEFIFCLVILVKFGYDSAPFRPSQETGYNFNYNATADENKLEIGEITENPQNLDTKTFEYLNATQSVLDPLQMICVVIFGTASYIWATIAMNGFKSKPFDPESIKLKLLLSIRIQQILLICSFSISIWLFFYLAVRNLIVEIIQFNFKAEMKRAVKSAEKWEELCKHVSIHVDQDLAKN